MSFTNQSDLMLEDNASKYPAIEVLAKLGYLPLPLSTQAQFFQVPEMYNQ